MFTAYVCACVNTAGCAAGPFLARDGVPYNAIWGRACIENKFTCQENKKNVYCPVDICRVEYLCAVFQF
jgi:hypothetical protein